MDPGFNMIINFKKPRILIVDDSFVIRDLIKSFYEETPFPNYEELESTADLMEKAQQGVFARLLNEQTPFNIRVLEAGCGTGQLSNFLATAAREVFGTDMCLNSLKLAQEFKKRNDLHRAGFYQMNLFRPIFRPESFHLVISNGVLHHTSDPFGGFKSIGRLVKKGGYIIVGLYHKHGRIITDLRRGVFTITKDRFKFLDPRLRADIGDAKKNAWFKDQYKNPHESKHTVGEVLAWFERSGFEFVNAIPKLTIFSPFSEQEPLFKNQEQGTFIDHLLVKSKLVFTGSKEGGFFIMIGRKKKA